MSGVERVRVHTVALGARVERGERRGRQNDEELLAGHGWRSGAVAAFVALNQSAEAVESEIRACLIKGPARAVACE